MIKFSVDPLSELILMTEDILAAVVTHVCPFIPKQKGERLTLSPGEEQGHTSRSGNTSRSISTSSKLRLYSKRCRRESFISLSFRCHTKPSASVFFNTLFQWMSSLFQWMSSLFVSPKISPQGALKSVHNIIIKVKKTPFNGTNRGGIPLEHTSPSIVPGRSLRSGDIVCIPAALIFPDPPLLNQHTNRTGAGE